VPDGYQPSCSVPNGKPTPRINPSTRTRSTTARDRFCGTVALIAEQPIALMARPGFCPAGNLQQFIAYAKSEPGRHENTARPAPAFRGPALLRAAQCRQTGFTITHVPYRGSAPANAGT